MAARDRIRTERLEGRIRELAGAGKSSREIAATLTASGHKVSHETVAKFIREETRERREAAAVVVAAEAQATVPFVTDSLQKLATLALKHADKTDDDRARASLISAGNSTLATLHKIVVGDEPQKSGADLLVELGDILDRRRRRTE